LKSIAVTPASVSINTAATQQLIATGTYSDGSTANITSSVTWATTNAGIATVNTGLVTGVAAGSGVAITASLGAATGTSVVSVTSPAIALIGITVSAQSMWIGQKFDLQAADAVYSNNTGSHPYTFVSWTSSNPAVATVDSQGVWTALSAGTTTMTATSGSLSAFNTLTVTAPPLLSITVLPATPTIATGATVQMSAIGIYPDTNLNKDITSSVTWSSSNPAAVTVNSAGLARGVGAGSATIGAALGVTGVAIATVPATAPVQVTVTLTPTADNTISISNTTLDAAWHSTTFPVNAFHPNSIAVGCNWLTTTDLYGFVFQYFQCAQSLVKFSLATIPAGKTIVSATLRLQTNIYGVGYVPRTWFVHALASNAAWSGATVTWDSAFNFQYYLASATSFNPPYFSNQIYNIDQTNTVRNWVGGTYANNGLEFGLDDLSFPYAISLDAFEFFSSEDPGGRGPKLIVTYQ
jgi:hypothetical protein